MIMEEPPEMCKISKLFIYSLQSKYLAYKIVYPPYTNSEVMQMSLNGFG
jgi:hypothetical protein